jgi:hypothetical protein
VKTTDIRNCIAKHCPNNHKNLGIKSLQYILDSPCYKKREEIAFWLNTNNTKPKYIGCKIEGI